MDRLIHRFFSCSTFSYFSLCRHIVYQNTIYQDIAGSHQAICFTFLISRLSSLPSMALTSCLKCSVLLCFPMLHRKPSVRKDKRPFLLAFGMEIILKIPLLLTARLYNLMKRRFNLFNKFSFATILAMTRISIVILPCWKFHQWTTVPSVILTDTTISNSLYKMLFCLVFNLTLTIRCILSTFRISLDPAGNIPVTT